MYIPKYDYKLVLQDLREHNVDLKKFEIKVRVLSKSSSISQQMFEFLYDVLKINNYNIEIFFSKK